MLFALTIRFLLSPGSPSGHWHFGGGGQTPSCDQSPARCQVFIELPWGDGVAVTVRALPFVTRRRDTPDTLDGGEARWMRDRLRAPSTVPPHCPLRPLSAVSTPAGAEPWSLPAGSTPSSTSSRWDTPSPPHSRITAHHNPFLYL